MPNFHPPLVAFPIALLSLVLFLEFWQVYTKADFHRVISIVLNVSMVFVVLAFFSGYQASEFADQGFKIPDDVIERHHSFGRYLLFVIFPCVALKYLSKVAAYNKKLFSWLYWLSLLISLGLIVASGYSGGELVFRYGAGVSAGN